MTLLTSLKALLFPAAPMPAAPSDHASARPAEIDFAALMNLAGEIGDAAPPLPRSMAPAVGESGADHTPTGPDGDIGGHAAGEQALHAPVLPAPNPAVHLTHENLTAQPLGSMLTATGMDGDSSNEAPGAVVRVTRSLPLPGAEEAASFPPVMTPVTASRVHHVADVVGAEEMDSAEVPPEVDGDVMDTARDDDPIAGDDAPEAMTTMSISLPVVQPLPDPQVAVSSPVQDMSARGDMDVARPSQPAAPVTLASAAGRADGDAALPSMSVTAPRPGGREPLSSDHANLEVSERETFAASGAIGPQPMTAGRSSPAMAGEPKPAIQTDFGISPAYPAVVQADASAPVAAEIAPLPETPGRVIASTLYDARNASGAAAPPPIDPEASSVAPAAPPASGLAASAASPVGLHAGPAISLAEARSEAITLLQIVRDYTSGRHPSKITEPSHVEAFMAAQAAEPSLVPDAAINPVALTVPQAPVLIAPPTPVIGAGQPADIAAAMSERIVQASASGQWIDGLASDIARLAASGDRGSFSLTTAALGQVDVAIRPLGEGVAISLMVDSEAAELALREESDALRRDPALAALRVSEVRVDRAPPVAEIARAEPDSQRPSSQSGQNQTPTGSGQSSGQAPGQQGRWQGQENLGSGHKARQDHAVLRRGGADDAPYAGPRIAASGERYA